MQTQRTQQTFEFEGRGRREVVARFDGGPITSDGGGLFLRQIEDSTDIIGQMARCFTDFRDEELIEHSFEDLLRQRIFAIALGYEDLNDHDHLRYDPLLATLVGKAPTSEARAVFSNGRQDPREPWRGFGHDAESSVEHGALSRRRNQVPRFGRDSYTNILPHQ